MPKKRLAAKKHQKRQKINPNTILIIVSLIISAYFFYVVIDIEQYKSKIEQRTEDFNNQLTSVTGMLTVMVNETKTELGSEISLLEKMLEATNEENKRLLEFISAVDNRTSIQLKELKGELKDVKTNNADFSAVAGESLKSVVSIATDKAQGSGAIITEDGFIVTNYHVIKDAKAARILTYDGKVYRTALVGTDTNLDIAVLKIEGSFRKLEFGNSDNVKPGQKVIALGNPAGFDFSVTEGIISAVNRIAPNGNAYIQTDVPINPGNSGGPLVDTSGKLIGITNFKIEGMESIGFALPSNTVKGAVESILNRNI